MNLHRNNALRWFTTLMLITTWLLASNHCAIGFMQASRMTADHQDCCGHSAKTPSSPADQTPVKECCRSLQGTLPAATAMVTPPVVTDFVSTWLALWEQTLALPIEKDVQHSFETSPPREARTFAQLVLHRSLPSLAPPALV